MSASGSRDIVTNLVVVVSLLVIVTNLMVVDVASQIGVLNLPSLLVVLDVARVRRM